MTASTPPPPDAGPPAPNRWRGPLLLRLGLAVAAALAVAANLPEQLATRLPDLHGGAKFALSLAQALLLRRDVLPVALVGAAGCFAVIPALPGRVRLAALVLPIGALAVVPGVDVGGIGLGALLLVLNGRAPGGRGLARWIPGAEVVAPVPFLDALGVPRAGLLPALARAVLALPLAVGWWAADTALGLDAHEAAVLAWDRPLDPDLRVAARAPDGVRCEFHDIDLLPDRYHVVREGSRFLEAHARDDDRVLAAVELPPYWGPDRGLVLDSETDGERTWYLRVPDHLIELAWSPAASTGGRPEEGRWEQVGKRRLRSPLTHSYVHRVPELGRLFLHEIGVGPSPHGRVVSVALPDLDDMRDIVVHGHPGEPPPPRPRDLEWIPPLQRFALAPDMGDRLWLEDPLTGLAEPWTALPTMNGKLRWVPELERLFVAVPSRGEVLVLTTDGAIERTLPAPYGVRPVEVDAGRGVYVVASVLSDQVEIRSLADGALVRRLGSVMPMARELRLDTTTGEGWLGTWTVLYRFRYGAGESGG